MPDAAAVQDVPPRDGPSFRARQARLAGVPGVDAAAGTRGTPEGRRVALRVGVSIPRPTGPTDGPLPMTERHYRRLRALKSVTNGLA